jgi:hypothetical protein
VLDVLRMWLSLLLMTLVLRLGVLVVLLLLGVLRHVVHLLLLHVARASV